MYRVSFWILVVVSMLIGWYACFKIKEQFSQCMQPLTHILSVDVEIIINEDNYVFEYAISKFRKLLKDNKIKKNDFIKTLNNLDEIKKSKTKYEIIHTVGDEIIIYRGGKYYGFHIIFEGNNVVVKGIVNDYDLISRYLKESSKTLEEIKLLYSSDPRLANYSGMSASSET
uniref:Uncharacterized protein n=1 Tax=Pyramimonas orientalis virus TaxID=455367 RepID=A0A7M3UNZ4_POV01|nr:hypothetical protein HWQ62_00307 [Pyramimonas orientalis virus]